MAANINMRGVQEAVEDNTKKAREVGRKAMLAYLGLWGMGYDAGKTLYKDRWAWIEKAEKRGVKVEKELKKLIEAYQKDFPGEVKKLAQTVEENVTEMAKDMSDEATKLGKNLEKYVTKAVRSTRVAEVIEDIKVDSKAALSGTAEEALGAMAEAEEAVLSAVDNIWYGYDNLSVKEILADLEAKTTAELELLREYEIGSKNRVTVLREIDARLQAMTS